MVLVAVVAVELHGETAAGLIGDSEIPASSDAEIVGFRNYMPDAGIVGGQFGQRFGGAVGGVIVDHDYVEREIGLLGER